MSKIEKAFKDFKNKYEKNSKTVLNSFLKKDEVRDIEASFKNEISERATSLNPQELKKLEKTLILFSSLSKYYKKNITSQIDIIKEYKYLKQLIKDSIKIDSESDFSIVIKELKERNKTLNHKNIKEIGD
jgi:biotin-(acetyl-CoA carboxylase) ligase